MDIILNNIKIGECNYPNWLNMPCKNEIWTITKEMIKCKMCCYFTKEINRIDEVRQQFCNSINCVDRNIENKDEECSCISGMVITFLLKEKYFV